MKKLPVAIAFVLASLTPLFSAQANEMRSPRLAAAAFPAPMPRTLSTVIEDAARRYDLDPNLLAAMAFKESAFNPTAVSRRGAQGILQLMPRTARYLGVRNAFDIRENVFGGARYLRELLDRFDGDVDLALAAYNLGPERIAKEGPGATPGVVRYVGDIKSYYRIAQRSMRG